jgi:uncharacterized protein
LAGASDIIAETISENAEVRTKMRELFVPRKALSIEGADGKEQEGIKYKDYFDWTEPVKSAPSHRILAMRRGEKEEILWLDIKPPKKMPLLAWKASLLKGNNAASDQVRLAIAMVTSVC